MRCVHSCANVFVRVELISQAFSACPYEFDMIEQTDHFATPARRHYSQHRVKARASVTLEQEFAN